MLEDRPYAAPGPPQSRSRCNRGDAPARLCSSPLAQGIAQAQTPTLIFRRQREPAVLGRADPVRQRLRSDLVSPRYNAITAAGVITRSTIRALSSPFHRRRRTTGVTAVASPNYVRVVTNHNVFTMPTRSQGKGLPLGLGEKGSRLG
jgi:hypothetical protein